MKNQIRNYLRETDRQRERERERERERAREREISYMRRKQLCSQVTAGRRRIESIFVERNNKCSFFPFASLFLSASLFSRKKKLNQSSFQYYTKISTGLQA